MATTRPITTTEHRRTGAPTTAGTAAWPRWANIVLGAWLFISAFLWPHTAASTTNTWIVGLAIFVAAVIALYVPWFRFVNTVLAIYLFISTLSFAHGTPGTTWNNLIVAILVFVASLIPGSLHATPRGRRELAPA